MLDVSDFKHYRINHSELFARSHNHINGIDNFWSQAKRHMRKFNDIPKAHFELFLKECEWRFNTPNYKEQINQLKQMVKGNLTQLSMSAPRINSYNVQKVILFLHIILTHPSRTTSFIDYTNNYK